MPVILFEKDPFSEAETLASDNAFSSNFNVRRPIYGMTIKSPRFAYISVLQDNDAAASGAVPISLVDSSAPGGYSEANHNFILQAVQESRQERVQIIETFGDHFAFFYGEKPIVLQVSGILFNTADFNWKNEWLRNYDLYLRGTRCVENRARVFLGWDDVLAQGYVLNAGISYDAMQPNLCPFSFSMLLTKPPTDLSIKNQIDVASSEEEITYTNRGTSSLVNQAEEARTLSDGRLVEYHTALLDYGRYAIDPATGNSVRESGSQGDAPATLEDPRTATWVGGATPTKRIWRDESAALQAFNAQLMAQQTGRDVVTVRQELRKAPETSQLASRDVAASIAPALGTGVTNKAIAVRSVQ